MTEHSPSAIGTVAQEAARLIEDMATMARSGYSRGDATDPQATNKQAPNPYLGEPAQEPSSPDAPSPAGPVLDDELAQDDEVQGSAATDDPVSLTCSLCGAAPADVPGDDVPHDETPTTCKLCPLCRGIALLRSVRPETVDLLADLAVSVAASLRDVAMRSRASEPPSSRRPAPGGSPDPDRRPVQDIPVDDETEG